VAASPSTAFERALQVGAGLAVSLLAWPADEDLRRHLSAMGLPALLLVEAAAAPPASVERHEDWMRLPADPVDLAARATALAARSAAARVAAAGPAPVPWLDDDGLLHTGGAWVAITEAQLPVVRLLVARFDRVVGLDVITSTCAASGSSGHPTSVRTLLTRIGQRVRGADLELVTIRQRGVLLRRAAA
jgi:hypothetical protein